MRLPRVLITAGPTHEPIDGVRYLANRSSGRVGIEIAEAALDAGWTVTLALGPTHLRTRTPSRSELAAAPNQSTHDRTSRFHNIHFRTAADLERLLARHACEHDILVMAAAVADFRPVQGDFPTEGKVRRTGQEMVLRLESTPDLLAARVAERRKSATGTPSLIVAFALEPAEGLVDAARAKLQRKGADLIVANPLETMDADTISADLISSDGIVASTGGKVPKADFGKWLIQEITERLSAGQTD